MKIILLAALGLAGAVYAGPAAKNAAPCPDCRTFNLKELIKSAGSPAPEYQCLVSPQLGRSSQPDDAWIQRLAAPQAGQPRFRSVINLRGENNDEAEAVQAAGLTAKHIPVRDFHAPKLEQVTEFLDFVSSPENQPALVHCKAGQGRTGTFVAAYRLAVQGWTLEEALSEARAFNVGPEQLGFLRANAAELKKWRGGAAAPSAAAGWTPEELDAGAAAEILRTAAPYDVVPKYLVPKKGARFYKDLRRGKWSWAGMPVAAFLGDKGYRAKTESVGWFFEPVSSADQAYELVTFLPSYWTFSKRSVKRAKNGGWTVRVNAVGMNKSQKTVLTYEVAPDGRCILTENSDPAANPTEGIKF